MQPDVVPQGVEFVWEQAEKRLEAQLRQADALDTKAGVLVGIHALAAGLVASVAGRLQGTGRLLGIVIVLGLLLSGWLAVLVYRAQQYDRRPSPEELWRFGAWTEEAIRFRFLSTRFEAIESNRRKLKRKAVLLTVSVVLVGVIASIVGTAGVVNLII